MSAGGIAGTAYAITDLIGGGGYMTSAQLVEMDTAGWDIGNHTQTHTVLTTLTQAQVETELTNAQTALEGWGLTRASRHVAYPGGAVNATVRAAMTATSMLTGRTIVRDWVNPDLVGDYDVPAYDVGDKTLTEVQAWIQGGIDVGRYVLLIFHTLVETPTLPTHWAISDFHDLIDWIVSQGFDTLTISELYDLFP